MTANGLKINIPAIAEGMYNIVCEAGQDHIVAWGMLPEKFIETLDRLVREKIIALAATECGLSKREVSLLVDEEKMVALVRPIMHEIAVGIYSVARARGKMVV